MVATMAVWKAVSKVGRYSDVKALQSVGGMADWKDVQMVH